MRYVLSIDGGGIRGIIPALICKELECYAGKGVCQLFDLFAGTSTGGIVALGLVTPSKGHPPHIGAESLVKLYEEKGPLIFSDGRKFITNLRYPKYDVNELENALSDYFGDVLLSNAVKPVMVTTYNIEQRRPTILKSWKACVNPHHDCLMKEAARATSAAPTYFAPALVKDRPLIDGGIYANNPSLVAYAEAKRLWPAEDITLVSLGTGSLELPFFYGAARKWGLARWAQPLLECVFDGVNDATDYIVSHLLPKDHYYRFQYTLQRGSESLDNASPQNIRSLKVVAQRFLREHREVLWSLVTKLSAENRNCNTPNPNP